MRCWIVPCRTYRPGLRLLAAAGVDTPEVGYEYAEAGVVVAEAELAWPAASVCVLLEGQAEFIETWANAGWRALQLQLSADWAERTLALLKTEHRNEHEPQTQSCVVAGVPAEPRQPALSDSQQGAEVGDPLSERPHVVRHQLREDSKARDPNLRSVRIDQDWRGIIFKPVQDDVYVLLHVAHHDEAYRWAEHRKLAINPVTGAMQLVILQDVVETPQQPTPVVAPQPVRTRRTV